MSHHGETIQDVDRTAEGVDGVVDDTKTLEICGNLKRNSYYKYCTLTLDESRPTHGKVGELSIRCGEHWESGNSESMRGGELTVLLGFLPRPVYAGETGWLAGSTEFLSSEEA